MRNSALSTDNKLKCAFGIFIIQSVEESITVAARSKAWTVYARSNAGIVGSNPTHGMDVCVRLMCVLSSVCR
jgi:hypothetical protein